MAYPSILSAENTSTTSRPLGACTRCSSSKLKCIRDGASQDCHRCRKWDLPCRNRVLKPMGRPSLKRKTPGADYDNDNDITTTNPPSLVLPDQMATAPSTYIPAISDVNGHVDDLDFLNFLPTPNSFDGIFGQDVFPVTNTVLPTTSTGNPVLNTYLNDQTIVPLSRDHACSPPDSLHSPATQTLHEPSNEESLAIMLDRLGKLNVALCQHPLHSCRKDLEIDPVSNVDSTNPSEKHLLPEISLADLGFGRLLSMTLQTKVISKRLHILDELEKSDPDNYDTSTALMALSCYVRLETICTRTATLLTQIHDGRRNLKDMHLLIPTLTIDGFTVPQGYCLQVDITLMLCNRILTHVRRVINLEGNSSVARARSQLAARVEPQGEAV